MCLKWRVKITTSRTIHKSPKMAHLCSHISFSRLLIYTQRNLFEILLNQTKIRLYLPYIDWFRTKRTSLWFQINQEMVNTIWFRFDLIIFRKDLQIFGKDLAVCDGPRNCYPRPFMKIAMIFQRCQILAIHPFYFFIWLLSTFLMWFVLSFNLLRMSETNEVPIRNHIWVASTTFKQL